MCKTLLEHGAKVNVLTSAGKASPLQRACVAGHVDVARLLLDHGADSSHVDADGENALHKVCQYFFFSLWWRQFYSSQESYTIWVCFW